MFKKKYHGGLKVLLLLLFIILLGMPFTCYANVSEDYVEYTIQTIVDNSNLSSTFKTRLTNYYLNVDSNLTSLTNNINSFLSTNNISALNNYNMILFVKDYSSFVSLNFCFSNVSIPNGVENLGFAYCKNIGLTNQNVSSNDRVYSYSLFVEPSGTPSPNPYVLPLGQGFNIDLGTVSLNAGTSVLTSQNVACYGIPSIYYYYDSNYIPVLLLDGNGNMNNNPVSPSGDNGADNSGESLTTGTITNPSGEVTGQIDLSNIENSLNNIENKIPTSGDIQNVIGLATENYWGSSGDLDGQEQENQISDNINDMMASLSGEMSQNEVFQQLESAEDGFLDLFRNHQDESYYDLAFEWNDFSYNGVVLIPAGSINISQMCRNNVQLGYIQGLIRIIFNFEVAVTLIYQIWNLILATLGIDNPFLYEDYNEVDRLDPTTGEVRSTLYRRKRIFRR